MNSIQTPIAVKRKTLDDNLGFDRISNLPDSILGHILSFLPTKYVVATTILSTQWKNLISSIPNLSIDLDDSLYLHPREESEEADTNQGDDHLASFIEFAYRVLHVILCDVHYISRFRLTCVKHYDDIHINEWISAALRLNVTLIELNIRMKNSELLLSSFCGCKMLKVLRLGQNFVVHVPDTFSLPNVTYLFLEYIEFLDEDSIQRLFAGCPQLEDLTMTCCDLKSIEVLNISIPTLKGLIIEGCNYDCDYMVVLDTPLLEVIHFCDYAAEAYQVKNGLNSLRVAHIEVGPSPEQLEMDTSYYDENVAELLAACTNTDFLYLPKISIDAIHSCYHPIPKFHNLTSLKLNVMGIVGWEFLALVLNNVPNLEQLIISEGFDEFTGGYATFQSSLPESVPNCLSLHLKEIDIWVFSGEDEEVKLVEYFLKNAKVLQNLKISANFRWIENLRILKNLFMLPKSSNTCKIFLKEEV